MVEKTVIKGDNTTAKVFLSEEDIEESCYDQVQNIVNHEAFTETVRIMPDAHWGAGCVIGFSMPITDKVIPNVIGLDIGCGMLAQKFGNTKIESHEKLDKEIRDTIPMGFEVRDFENSINIKEDFNWGNINYRLKTFEQQLGEPIEFGEYNIDYFKELCDRVDYDTTRAIKSVGSLGGGNHFIEFARDSHDSLWCVIHSGSRGLGKAIAEYWQDKAIELRQEEKANGTQDTFKDYVGETVGENYSEYVNNDLTFNKEQIRQDFDGEEIEKTFGKLGNAKGSFEDKIRGSLDYVDELAYLEGEERHGYFIDMIFAQEYASRSRIEMMKEVSEIIGEVPLDTIESVHNYIDFDDLVIRKGACRATKGERVVIPFNMKDGSVIARGKGNDDWNSTAPHGAGRNMGRREAYRKLDQESFEEVMEDIEGKFTEEMLDEAPMAYKEADMIQRQIEPTAEVEKELEVVHNIKAD